MVRTLFILVLCTEGILADMPAPTSRAPQSIGNPPEFDSVGKAKLGWAAAGDKSSEPLIQCAVAMAQAAPPPGSARPGPGAEATGGANADTPEVMNTLEADPVAFSALQKLARLMGERHAVEIMQRDAHELPSVETADKLDDVARHLDLGPILVQNSAWLASTWEGQVLEDALEVMDEGGRRVIEDKSKHHRSTRDEAVHMLLNVGNMLLVRPLTSGPAVQYLIGVIRPQLTPLVEGYEGTMGIVIFALIFLAVMFFTGMVMRVSDIESTKKSPKGSSPDSVHTNDIGQEKDYILRARCESFTLLKFADEDTEFELRPKPTTPATPATPASELAYFGKVQTGRKMCHETIHALMNILEEGYPLVSSRMTRQPRLIHFRGLASSSGGEPESLVELMGLPKILATVASLLEYESRKRALFCDAFSHPGAMVGLGLEKKNDFYLAKEQEEKVTKGEQADSRKGNGRKDFGSPACAPLYGPDLQGPTTKQTLAVAEKNQRSSSAISLEGVRDDVEHAIPLFVSTGCLKSREDIVNNILISNDGHQPAFKCEDTKCTTIETVEKKQGSLIHEFLWTSEIKNGVEVEGPLSLKKAFSAHPELIPGTPAGNVDFVGRPLYESTDALYSDVEIAKVDTMLHQLNVVVGFYCNAAPRLAVSGICPTSDSASGSSSGDSEQSTNASRPQLESVTNLITKFTLEGGTDLHTWMDTHGNDAKTFLTGLVKLVSDVVRDGKIDNELDTATQDLLKERLTSSEVQKKVPGFMNFVHGSAKEGTDPDPHDDMAGEAVTVPHTGALFGPKDSSVLYVAWWLAWNFASVKFIISHLERKKALLAVAENPELQEIAIPRLKSAVERMNMVESRRQATQVYGWVHGYIAGVSAALKSTPRAYTRDKIVSFVKKSSGDGDYSNDEALWLKYSHLVYKALVGLPIKS